MVIFRLLGPVSVGTQPDGGPPINSRVRALLVALLRAPGQYVPFDRLAEHAWSSAPVSVRANMRTYVAALRKALNACSPALGQRLETRRAGAGGTSAYRLAVDPRQVDATVFTELSDQGQRKLTDGDTRAAARTLATALDLWHGPIGEDLPNTLPVRSWVAILTERKLGAVEHLAEARLILGDHTGLVAQLRHYADEHPLRERPIDLLMRALYASGDRAGAIATYHDFRSRLADELGIEPSAPMQRGFVALLNDQPSLGPLTDGRPAIARHRPAVPNARRTA